MTLNTKKKKKKEKKKKEKTSPTSLGLFEHTQEVFIFFLVKVC